MRRRDVIQRYVWELRRYIRTYKSDIINVSAKRTERFGGFTATTRFSYDGIGKITVKRSFGRNRLLEFEKGMGLAELAWLEVSAAVADIQERLVCPYHKEIK